MRSAILCVAVSMTLLACGDDSPLGIFDQASLVRHQARWQSEGIHSYSFDLDQQDLAKSGNVHIVVQSDVVVSVVYRDTRVPPDDETGWPTIDDIYANAALIESRGHISNFAIEYDDQYGYPTLVSAYSAGTPAPGYSVKVSNFVLGS